MTGGHLGFLSCILFLYPTEDAITDTASFASFILSNKFLVALEGKRGVPPFTSFTERQREFCLQLLRGITIAPSRWSDSTRN
jgi:hypothetical protein